MRLGLQKKTSNKQGFTKKDKKCVQSSNQLGYAKTQDANCNSLMMMQQI